MKRSFLDRNFELIVPILGVIVALALIGGLINVAYGASCSRYGNIVGADHKYDFWAGCFIDTDSGWVNIDNYRELGN
jgi:hypothetical protein